MYNMLKQRLRCNNKYANCKSKKYAKIRNRSNQNPNPAPNQKREITNTTNSQNTKRTYGQPSEQLFLKRWPLSNRNRTKNNMNTHKVKHHRNSDTKNRQQRPTTNYRCLCKVSLHRHNKQPLVGGQTFFTSGVCLRVGSLRYGISSEFGKQQIEVENTEDHFLCKRSSATWF